MDSNIMFGIFGNFRMLAKLLTLGPLLITEILLKIQENTKSFKSYYFCELENLQIRKWDMRVPIFEFGNFNV